MAGSSRGNKLSRLKKDASVCLSDLSDAILIHILSFLPTKSLVSTSLLSRRWRYLWTSTPDLVLNEFQFRNDHYKFMNFAERALVLRKGPSLVSFFLSCRVSNDESRINTWITSAIQQNVEQLSLYLRGIDSFFLPFCIFGCQSLVKLDLHMSICIRVPSMICLPRLKHLVLKTVRFADNESAEKLLSHPLLEELSLYNCTWYNITTINVNSPSLQSLSIDDGGKEVWPEEQEVCFFGDNLKFFRYEGFLPPTQYCICGSTMQLRKAVILVKFHGHEVQYMDGPSNRYCKLLNSLSMVKNLTLSEETAQSLYLLSQCLWLQTTLPVFDRVTQLKLKGGYDDYGDDTKAISLDSMGLKMLYKICPHLEHLNLKSLISLDDPMEVVPILRPMPSCFRTHLKKVTLQVDEPIYKLEGDDEDDDEDCYHYINDSYYQNAFNLLLNSAPVLEEVVIRWTSDDISGQVSAVEELERELNARPKVSENCTVSIVLDRPVKLSRLVTRTVNPNPIRTL